MKQNFLTTERIRLRAMEPEDLDTLYDMENDPQTWDISNFSVPYSRYTLKRYIEDSQCDMFADRQLRLMITLNANNATIGTIDITGFEPMHARGEVGIAIQQKHQRQGYAKEALGLLCDYAFQFLRLKQLTAHIATDNAACLNLFHACGFEQCGLLKEWWHVKDKYKDVALFQQLRPASL